MLVLMIRGDMVAVAEPPACGSLPTQYHIESQQPLQPAARSETWLRNLRRMPPCGPSVPAPGDKGQLPGDQDTLCLPGTRRQLHAVSGARRWQGHVLPLSAHIPLCGCHISAHPEPPHTCSLCTQGHTAAGAQNKNQDGRRSPAAGAACFELVDAGGGRRFFLLRGLSAGLHPPQPAY